MLEDVTGGQGAVVAAIISAGAAISAPGFNDWLRQNAQDKRMLAAFYGELQNIFRHYRYAGAELPSDIANKEFGLRLALAAYGEAALSRQQVSQIRLRASEITAAMELLLLVRNNDLRIEAIKNLLENEPHVAAAQVGTLKSRMTDCCDLSYSILALLHKRGKRLGELPAWSPKQV
jgi:hypothetical protein